MIQIEKETAFNLIYDFLKRNRIIREFIIEAFDYHRSNCIRNGIDKPFGRENTKKIILFLINKYQNRRAYLGASLNEMFMSFDGSFEWAASTQGLPYWRDYLQDKWKRYLRELYNDNSIQIR